MAQMLEAFEENVEPIIEEQVARYYKALVRRKLNDLATDMGLMVDLIQNDEELNDLAQHQKDRL